MATYVPQKGDFVTLSFDPQFTSEIISLAWNAEKGTVEKCVEHFDFCHLADIICR